MINFFLGFYEECKERYGLKIWHKFNDCFNCLPLGAIIEDKILCIHGGLSPDIKNLEQIRRIVRPTEVC